MHETSSIRTWAAGMLFARAWADIVTVDEDETMQDISEEKLQHLRQLLHTREQELRDDIRRELASHGNYSEIVPTMPDPADASFAALASDLGNAEVTRDVNELRAIAAARMRMDEGNYGACVDCGTDIPYERLEALPTAERCAPCQEQYEKTHAAGMRGGTM
jgi:DnaK suppressor protein